MPTGKLTIDSKYDPAYKLLISDLVARKNTDDTNLVEKAYHQLIEKCSNQFMFEKRPLIPLVLDSARIAVNDIGLGRTSVISLFLYHSFGTEVPDYTALEKEYGKDVSLITSGLINVSRIEEKSISSQAENFRRLLLNLAKDVRVILIILAEKLELMREMKHFTAEVQVRAASEASYLYAPLAHRLGLYLIKSEMEDLSLKYTERNTYTEIARKLDETMRSRQSFITKFIEPIKTELKVQGFDFEIKGRPKSIHSIWNKMRKKEVGFDDIYDLFAIRIILKSELKNEKADCWQVYSAVTDIYQPNPLRMRDWISVPKSNGYESLHTTVIGPEGKWVEVQIRTTRMNEIAEKGVAAHWKYKGLESERGLETWLTRIREFLENPEPDAHEFIDEFKLSLYSKEIFIFTPKGDLKKFPANATVLDFAYDIHTQVGSNCTGAKVNGRVVPIRHKLQNGDKVEILTSKNQKPKLDWLNFVVTTRAQKKIRQALNEEQVREAENGKEILKRRLKNWKVEFNDEVVRRLLKRFRLPNAQELYCLISTEEIDITGLKDFIIAGEEDIQPEVAKVETIGTTKTSHRDDFANDYLVIDEKVANIDYKLAKCCNPIMGDNIFGFVTISEGIKIHRTNCPNAAQLLGKYGYRVVSARWTRKSPDTVFPVHLRITGEDQSSTLHSISEFLSKDGGVSLRSLKLDANEGTFSGSIGIVVRDINHLDFVIRKLSAIKGVDKVSRLDKK